MKKLSCLWIVLVSLLLCVSASAESSVWGYDTLNQYLTLDGTASGDVVIPDEVDGASVKALRYSLFAGQSSITSLTLPDSVEALGASAISGMDSLTFVQLSASLSIIEKGNFSSCPALTSVTLPATVCYVSDAFYFCDNLREIRFEGVCPIFNDTGWCFNNLPDDCVIYVPDNQVDAYKAAIGNANGAADRIRASGQNAVAVDYTADAVDFEFHADTGTITAYLGSSARVDVPAIIDGVQVRAIGEFAFNNYTVRYCVLPEGVEAIGDCAFYQASNLRVVTFPSTLRTIGTEAFFNAQACIINWNEGLEEIGMRAFMYDAEPSLSLPSSVKTIGESAFEGAQCTELYLGGAVEKIGARAFADTNLTYLAFDLYTPIDIAADAFVDTRIADLDLPWDSSMANRDAYEALIAEQCPDCTVWINNPVSGGVAELPVNDTSITTIQNGVWTTYTGNAADLTVWTDYDQVNVFALGDGLFKSSQTIHSFYPHHCGWFTTIGAECFAESSIAYVELFGSVTTIGNGAFRNCLNLTELTIPASVTSIGSGFLSGCANLQKLIVLCDPSILPADALDGCTALTELYAAADATDAQVKTLSDLAGRAWNQPALRIGETVYSVQAMPYKPTTADDFWYDETYARLDQYNGGVLNLVLPREIDGVQLTLIGGTMMSRASTGDNFTIELPVRSVVIPENYTTLTEYGFANCATLETVICYAPVETLPSGFFSGCTALRQVVFVNGVRTIEANAFADCVALETVYLGSFIETMDERAFMNTNGDSVFDAANCLYDVDQLPDIDALLGSVTDEGGLAEPEPASEPNTAENSTAVGNDMSDRMDVKYAMSSADVQGVNMTPAMMGGLEYAMTFHADGTVDFVLAGSSVPGLTWTQGTADAEDGTVIDTFIIDYYGTPLSVILTADGFDMNYFDSMLIHYAISD